METGKEMAEPTYCLCEQEMADLTVKISVLLDGAPLGQALYVLKETKRLLLDGHLVDIKNHRFQEKRAELEAFCRESV